MDYLMLKDILQLHKAYQHIETRCQRRLSHWVTTIDFHQKLHKYALLRQKILRRKRQNSPDIDAILAGQYEVIVPAKPSGFIHLKTSKNSLSPYLSLSLEKLDDR